MLAPDPTPRPLDHLAECGRDAAPALVLRDRTLSWQDLRSRVARLAGWLAEQVPERGSRVATWAAKGELTCLRPGNPRNWPAIGKALLRKLVSPRSAG